MCVFCLVVSIKPFERYEFGSIWLENQQTTYQFFRQFLASENTAWRSHGRPNDRIHNRSALDQKRATCTVARKEEGEWKRGEKRERERERKKERKKTNKSRKVKETF